MVGRPVEPPGLDSPNLSMTLVVRIPPWSMGRMIGQKSFLSGRPSANAYAVAGVTSLSLAESNIQGPDETLFRAGSTSLASQSFFKVD